MRDDYISKAEVAMFLHRIVTSIQSITDDKNKRQDIGMLHNDIYMFLEKPKL